MEQRRPGVFISLDLLVALGIALVAAAVTVLIAIVPRLGLPVGAGATVATLLFTVWTRYAGRGGGSR
jgi:hypothetical protein